MSNLTISLDDQTIKAARVRAIQQGTSLSAKVREFLASYASGVSLKASTDTTSELLRLMTQVREEARQNRQAATASPAADNLPATERKTLREEMYADDFRANASAAALPDASHESGPA